jgi:hypothetical protein
MPPQTDPEVRQYVKLVQKGEGSPKALVDAITKCGLI